MPGSRHDEEFSAFVRTRRIEMVRAACLLTAGDTHRAEDLVQTALARLYVVWPRMRRSGGEAAYAWRIIVNAHLDEIRRPRWRRERSVPELPDEPEAAAGDSLPGEIGGDTIRAALAALPPRMRAVIVLRYWLDLSIGQTADLMNCSEGTVKSQAAKAAARLRELLTRTASERTSR